MTDKDEDFLNFLSSSEPDDFSGMGAVDIPSLSSIIKSYLTISNKNKIEIKEIKIIEVGTWKGRSALTIANTIINLNLNIKTTIYCIDQVWKGGTEYYPDNINIYKIFQNNIRKFNELFNINEQIKIEPIIKSSEKAISLFENNSIDIIFLDGDHRYKGFKNDISGYYQKLKSGGLLCGHDCEHYFTNLSDKLKELILDINNKNEDTININENESIHPGVVLGLHEFFTNLNQKNRYKILNKIWYLEKK